MDESHRTGGCVFSVPALLGKIELLLLEVDVALVDCVFVMSVNEGAAKIEDSRNEGRSGT